MSKANRSSSEMSYKSTNSSNSNDTTNRLGSPPPGSRHISSKRILNVERISLKERSPLLERNGAESMPPRFIKGINMYSDEQLQSSESKGSNIDTESIVYCSSPKISDTNKMEVSFIDSYMPGMADGIEDLEWRDILPYYFPFMSWINEYCLNYFMGDLVGGLTLVFFQLPLSLSYADSLAHVPVTCGLLSLGISPLIYMVFGSVPQMIVGPEGAISLVVGQAVEPLLHHAYKKHLDPVEYVVAITFVSGASLLGFGLGRLGYLDNVLSASLLKGFISGVGFVMVINSFVVMLGLEETLQQISKDPNVKDIHSPFDKLVFIFENFTKYNNLTFKISISGFLFIIVFKYIKKICAKSKNNILQRAHLIPEIMIAVTISALLCSHYNWPEQGIKIVGSVNNEDALRLYNPISPEVFPLIRKLSTSGFLCAMLGFFESTTASKSLGSTYNLPISSNRELVALGFINIFGSLFGALPAFGGYGRSKINAISAKTTMSGAIMGILSLLVFTFFLDWCYYIPKCSLSVITAVIGLSLIEEAPYEIYFHWRSRGFEELLTFAVTVLTTLFYSMEVGIAVGLVYSLIRVIRHSTESRIQILGRTPGTEKFVDADISLAKIRKELNDSHHMMKGNYFENFRRNNYLKFFSDENGTHLNTEVLEEIEGCLIIKIPEPLTFTNSNDLKTRLKRVEMYGSTKVHPAAKRTRSESMTKYIIFDLNGMTEIDSSASQVLKNLLRGYKRRNIHFFFVRVNKNDNLRKRLCNSGITKLLLEDLIEIKYFDVQQRSAFYKMRQRRSIGEISPTLDIEINADVPPIDIDEFSSIYDLTESSVVPYFNHITDALKIIDYYEINHPQSNSELFEIDSLDRRSGLTHADFV